MEYMEHFFETVSLAHTAVNLQYSNHWSFHHTLNTSLHYLVNFSAQKAANISQGSTARPLRRGEIFHDKILKLHWRECEW